MHRPVIILDGLNVFIRHYFVNEAVDARSEPIGGVVGFLRFVDMLASRFSPGKFIVVWENGGPSPRRKKISSTYKEGRKKLKEIRKASSNSTIKDLLRDDVESKVKQLGLLYQLLKCTPVCQIFIKETECDDIIGYLAKYKFARDSRTKLIISSDKDFYQLLDNPTVKIYDPARKITIDADYVMENYNISPRNFCLAKTIQGDASDNIEGVPGIGFKTISKRFPVFADKDKDVNIDGLLEECRNYVKAGTKLKAPKGILECENLIRTNWRLMYLDSSNLSASQIEKVDGTLEQHEPKMDKLGLIKKVTKAEMNMSFDFDRFSINLKRCLIFD